MNDGRMYTNFESNAKSVKKTMEKNYISNNEEYRRFMTKNALKIMKQNQVSQLVESNTYLPINDPNNFVLKPVPDKNHPHLYDSVMDQMHPYGYETNPVKSQYLTREALNSKAFNRYKM